MKVTQGNKGPAVSREVGVESGTQEFPASLGPLYHGTGPPRYSHGAFWFQPLL
jgi:hypothetical protein